MQSKSVPRVAMGILVALAGCAGDVADVSPPSGEPPSSGVGASASIAGTIDGRPDLAVSPPIEVSAADVDWWRQVGSTSIDHASALAVDAEGGLVVAGELRETVDFGGASVSALGAGDAFVARYAADGTLGWVVGLGARQGTANAEATDVAVGADGLVAVTGTFEGTLETVGVGGEGPAPLEPSGGSDVFVAAIDSDGHPLWARSLASDTYDQGGGVAIDSAGRVIVAAEVGYATRVESIARDGTVRWSRQIGHVSTNYSNIGAVQSVGVDSAGDLFVTGSFTGTASFGGDELRSAGGGDVFLAKLSGLDGSHLWSRRFGSPLSVIAEIDNGWDLLVTADDDVVVGGDFHGPIDFGGGPLEASRAGYVARYRGIDGAYVWSRVIDGAGFDTVSTLAATPEGEIVAAGAFTRGTSLGALHASGIGSYLARMSPADGSVLAASVINTAEGVNPVTVAIAPAGRAFVALDFYGDVAAGGRSFRSHGFSDFLLGRTRTP